MYKRQNLNVFNEEIEFLSKSDFIFIFEIFVCCRIYNPEYKKTVILIYDYASLNLICDDGIFK